MSQVGKVARNEIGRIMEERDGKLSLLREMEPNQFRFFIPAESGED